MESAPWKVLFSGETEVLIDVDGGICIDGKVSHPFPCQISHAAICDGGLVATWVDHELRLARMALLPLDQPIKDGVDKGTLRKNRDTTMVEGAIWCHSLEAEPLSLVAKGDLVIFALWQRGIYATKSDSTEIWRTGLPEINENLPKGFEEICSINIVENIHVWTRGGSHLVLDKKSGDEISSSVIEIEADLDNVYHFEDKFLLSSKDGWVYSVEGENILVARHLRGCANHAAFDGADWRIICWRDDVILNGGLTTRENLGVQLIERGNQWMVLDNQGHETPHFD